VVRYRNPVLAFAGGALEQGFVFYSKRARPNSSFGRVFLLFAAQAMAALSSKVMLRNKSVFAHHTIDRPQHQTSRDKPVEQRLSFLYFPEWFSMLQTRNARPNSGLLSATSCSSQSHTFHIQTKIISG
jgi:hypothetical protein